MLRPQADEFARLAKQGNLIPVLREVPADFDTPLSLFRRLDDGRTSFLLESVQGGEKWARYSFIGCGSRALFRARGKRVEFTQQGRQQNFQCDGDPMEKLRAYLAEFQPVQPPNVQLPRFTGGAVGRVGWDWVRFVEDIPDTNPDPLGLHDLWFSFPETVVVHDNIKNTALIVQYVDLRGGADPQLGYENAARTIGGIREKLRAPAPLPPPPEAARAPMHMQTNLQRAQYESIVQRAKQYIAAGDVFQVVLGLRYSVPLQVDPFALYRQLRRINPSPYLFFMRMEEAVLIGASPEILVRLEGGRVDVRPLAGTRRRGHTEAEDAAMEKELLADPKERAEHVMLVDLGRNDVGRIAKIGSVQVSEYAQVERYSHVMHIVSHVQAQLRAGLDWLDVLRATFPAGTLSGAPKVRAMEIIDELETLRRGPFGGCAGYIDYSGNMDFAITIRTMLAHQGQVHVQAGAGIVADSSPRLEFKECENKARALIRALDLAREGFD